jgi:hypothetical protein
MDNYNKNLTAIKNLKKTHSEITQIENTLQKKYLGNTIDYKNINNILDNSMCKYHSIIKNLDKLIF